MEDLLKYQIKYNCKIAVPDGLKELMSDISREVLRAQPNDLYGFITGYLSSLLVTRENLTIASRICDNVCDNTCHPELEDELRFIGLDDESVEVAAKTIRKYFERDQVKEVNLLMTLMRETELSETQLEELQVVVHNAYQRHQMNHTITYQSSSDSDTDDATRAARHTLALYRKSKPSEWRYDYMKDQVNASYQAYENIGNNSSNVDELKTASEGNVTYSESDKIISEVQTRSPPKYKRRISLTSLAGSFVELGKYKPYNPNNSVIEDLEEGYDSDEIDIKDERKINFDIEASECDQLKEICDKSKYTSNGSEKSVTEYVINLNSHEIFTEISTSDVSKFIPEDGHDYNDVDGSYNKK